MSGQPARAGCSTVAREKFFIQKDAFSRERKITLPDLVGFILKKAAEANQHGLAITSQFYFAGNGCTAPNKQSLSEARQKLSWEFFKDFFYFLNQDRSQLKTWKSHSVQIADGTKVRTPCTRELKKSFGSSSSQHGDNHYPSLHILLLSDAFSSRPLDIAMGHCDIGERDLALQLYKKVTAGNIILLDRGLGGAAVYAELNRRDIFFVHRCVKSVGYVQSFIKSGLETKIFNLKIKDKQSCISLRLVRGKDLATGEALVYVTNLMSEQKYSPKEIHDLYGLRWKIETNIRILKNTLGLEKIKSKLKNSVLQDVYAHFIVLLLASMVQSEAIKRKEIPDQKSLCIKYILRLFAENVKFLCSQFLALKTWRKICELARDIVWSKQHGRHFPRCSQIPQNKWSYERSKIKKGL